MSHEERNTLANVVAGLLVYAYFLMQVWPMFHDGTSTAPDGVMLWARVVIWIVPVGILAVIVAIILASILAAIVTGERQGWFMADERDREIEMKGLATMAVLASFGFLLSVGLLAWGVSAFTAFNIAFFSFAAGSLAGDITRLWLYRHWG